MVTQVKTPQIYLPTGYEGLQQQAAEKRKLAETMWAKGLAGGQNQVSIAQVLGDLAQMWAGKSLNKDAAKLELDAANRMGEDYRTRYEQFYSDANSLSPQQMVAKWGSDPMAQNWLKPFEETMTAGMKQDQTLTDWGGQWMRKGDIQVGSYKPNNPNDSVVRGADGNWQVNPVKVTASIASQGIPLEDGTYSMQDPARSGQVPTGVPQAQQPKSAPNGYPEDLTLEQYRGAVNGLGGPAAQSWLQRNGLKVRVNTPAEADQLPSGTKIILPDGSEGEVP